MKTKFLLIFLILLTANTLHSQNSPVKIALLKYSGGGDWYSNPTSLPNLVNFCNTNIKTNISTEIATVEPGSIDIFNFPFIHMTGHGNVVFSESELENLRLYLLSGGFLHIDDNYGMSQFIRPQLAKLFPDKQLVEIPGSHPIFHQTYNFNSLPKIHEHDFKTAQAFGIFNENRLMILFTFECDLGDGWEDEAVHKDSYETRLKALQMGANIIQYVFNGD